MRQKNTAVGAAASQSNYAPNYTTTADAVRAFADEVYDKLGARLPDASPGELRRFGDPNRPGGDEAFWAVFYLDAQPKGVFGRCGRGETYFWKPDIQRQIPEEARYCERALA